MPKPDMFYVQVVQDVLNSAVLSNEIAVKMTGGELWLYHVLLQEYGLPLTNPDRFIPLMERSKARLELLKP